MKVRYINTGKIYSTNHVFTFVQELYFRVKVIYYRPQIQAKLFIEQRLKRVNAKKRIESLMIGLTKISVSLLNRAKKIAHIFRNVVN